MKLEFVEELPAQEPRISKWEPVLAALEEKPNHWAKVREYKNNQSARNTSSYLNKRYRQKGFDFAARGDWLYGMKVEEE